MFSSKSSSIYYLHQLLTNSTDEDLHQYTANITAARQEELDDAIEKITESLIYIFRRMLVNKRSIKEQMDNLGVTIYRHDDGIDEVSFFLNSFKQSDMVSRTLTLGQVVSSDEFYNKLATKLSVALEEVGGFVQNKLYDEDVKVKVIKPSTVFKVYPKVKFVFKKVFISANVCLSQTA